MKIKIITILIILLSWFFCPAFGQQTYYYYSGSKMPLEYSTQNIYIKFKETASMEDKRSILSVLSFSKKTDNTTLRAPFNFAIIELLEPKNKDEFQSILRGINNNENIVVALPFLQSIEAESLVGITEMFFVQLHFPEDYSLLERLAKETNTTIIREDEFVAGLYEIEATKNARGNALEMANFFYENGNFKYSTPDFIFKIQKHCATDSLFNEQWGLKNTGQSGGVAGMDINICEAWEITKGCSNIKIAVIDIDGVDLDHPDLIDNLLPGYDATWWYDDDGGCGECRKNNHGTACAGIIAAKSNTIGISGVAPDCKIIPIRISGGYSFAQTSIVQRAFNWAVQQGADILSNSWGGGVPSDLIEDAIANATTSGRNGLGCVVVFASGNENTIVQYPARHPKVIAVGAIDRCGIRSGTEDVIPNSCDPWISEDEYSGASCYGLDLDLVAPGTSVYTTDISGQDRGKTAEDYFLFQGTSAAAPFVAGVAALVLSVNSNLTYEEVYKYIMLGCDKTGGYSYNHTQKSGTCDLGYGTWDEQVGYGKVNTFKTLQYVLGSERYMNNLSGTMTGTANIDKWLLLQPCCISELPVGTYVGVKRYEIQKTINHSENEIITAISNGLSPDNQNYGYPYAKVTNLSDTSTTLTSYVYELFNVLGQSLGYKPVSPSNLRFDVKLYKKMDKDLYLKNTTIQNEATNFEAINHIETQNVTISGTSIVNFRSGNTIVWKEGTTITPSGNGIVRAYIEPFILGDCEPSYYISQKNNSLMSVVSEEFLIENEYITNEYTNVDVHPDIDFKFKLYPNPNPGTFQIKSNFSLSDIGNLKILNLLGATVYETQNLSSNTIQLPTTVSGTFFVAIILKDGAVLTQKMVVRR